MGDNNVINLDGGVVNMPGPERPKPKSKLTPFLLICRKLKSYVRVGPTGGFCQLWETWKMVQHYGKPGKLVEFNFS